jgi:uncharacterized protein YbjQ (UPF0145 family)
LSTELSNCPNCATPLKSGLLKSNQLLSEGKVKLINTINGTNNKYYCNKCGNDAFTGANIKADEEINKITNQLRGAARFIPVITTHSPYNWEYSVLGMVTGQSTTGTGMFSEVGGAVADLFGGQATRYNSKLKGGENLCFEQLRGQAIVMGGNAVIAADIDYSEVGGEKGMLMVCMAGTVVRLHNLNVLPDDVVRIINTISGIQERLKTLTQVKQGAGL